MILPVTLETIGLEGRRGEMIPLLPRYSTVPTGRTRWIGARYDHQDRLSIHLVAGHRFFAHDCRSLLRFSVPVRVQRRAVVQLEVGVDVDENGLGELVVTEPSGTGRYRRRFLAVTDCNAGLLPTREEIEGQIRDSEAHHIRDTAWRNVLPLRNQLDDLLLAIQELLDQAPPEVQAGLQRMVARMSVRRRNLNVAELEEMVQAVCARVAAVDGDWGAMVQARARYSDGLILLD